MADALEDFDDAVDYFLGGEVVADVVDACEEEDFGGVSAEHGAEALVDAFGGVAVDAAVNYQWVVEEFAPFAAVCEAVAEHNDIVGADAELVEQCGALSVEFAEFRVGNERGSLR